MVNKFDASSFEAFSQRLEALKEASNNAQKQHKILINQVSENILLTKEALEVIENPNDFKDKVNQLRDSTNSIMETLVHKQNANNKTDALVEKEKEFFGIKV